MQRSPFITFISEIKLRSLPRAARQLYFPGSHFDNSHSHYQSSIEFTPGAMAFGSLDQHGFRPDNRCMERTRSLRSSLILALGALICLLVLAGCAGVSAGSNTQPPPPPTTGALAVSPSTLNFGNVALGSSSSLTGTLSASTADVTVATVDWTGSGYSISGVSFPLSVAAGQSAKYTVTFTPAAAGSSSGSISFISNASDASLKQTFSGSGTQTTSPHTVSLTWDPSTSTVAGYNLYRGTQSGGPYSRMNSTLLSGTSYDDSGVQSGRNYFYVSTAVDASNNESAFSNEATAAIP